MYFLDEQQRWLNHFLSSSNGKKKYLALRKEVHSLYFEEGVSKTQIARRLPVSKGFVVRWTQEREQDLTVDGRGWIPGRRRIYDDMIEERIKELHSELKGDEREFFKGASAIMQEWRRKYPGEKIPSVRMIGVIMAEEGLSKGRPSGCKKGAARYLCYPEHTIYNVVTTRLLEADFIGEKHLRSQTAPVNFVGFSFKKSPRLRYYRRIEGKTTDALLRESDAFFERFETPDAIKVDNAAAMAGTGNATRSLSRFMHGMLTREVTPIFSVPRRPFSQASIEGNNSVFSRMFWNTHKFTDLADVDMRLEWFNDSSLRYCGWEPPAHREPSKTPFLPRVYFIRQVRDDNDDTGRATVDVQRELIELPPEYMGYFVLAEWRVTEARLLIHYEKEQQAEVIESVPFEPNPNSSYKLV